jgi:hypothetical protein
MRAINPEEPINKKKNTRQMIEKEVRVLISQPIKLEDEPEEKNRKN